MMFSGFSTLALDSIPIYPYTICSQGQQFGHAGSEDADREFARENVTVAIFLKPCQMSDGLGKLFDKAWDFSS